MVMFLFFVVHLLQVARSGWGSFRSMVTGYMIERRPATVRDEHGHDDNQVEHEVEVTS